MPTQHFNGTIIIGAGPSGLMIADILSAAGKKVRIYESMPTPGRKFLMAGRGGLNITHSEDFDQFVSRYGEASATLYPLLKTFGPREVIEWMTQLGQESFIGSSGRVFPKAMKAAPLLRTWLDRLKNQGTELITRHRCIDWQDHHLTLESPDNTFTVTADQIVFATGGGSWKKLGTDGQWTALFKSNQIKINPLVPSNCGFISPWSDHLREHYAGKPLKGVVLSTELRQQKGDLVLTEYGLEGGLLYAFSAELRDQLQSKGRAKISLDLMPDIQTDQLGQRLSKPKGRNSLSNHLRKIGIAPIKSALVRDCCANLDKDDMNAWAQALKSCPVLLTDMRPMDEAISTAGGVSFEELNKDFSLKSYPNVFCSGEMIDWDAPTGGYLLTACLSMGFHLGHAILARHDG